MAHKYLIFLCATVAVIQALPTPEVEIITAPKPGQEYVYVQSTATGSRPISRKDKDNDQERPFETGHKIPSSLTFALNLEEEAEDKDTKSKPQKREALPDGPAPVPPGAMKLPIEKLLEMYKNELKTSTTTTAKPKTTAKSSRRRGGNKRTKKEAKPEDEGLVPTSPSPILTTGKAIAKSIDLDDIPLVAAGSEKQRSRIQIKKGPNGQDYEYEYVYYYYDDDEDAKDKKVFKSKKLQRNYSRHVEQIETLVESQNTNANDGQSRNQISRDNKTRGKTAAPEVNEVVPSASHQKTRGRQLGEEDTVNEERLPANTRFPPRSRNLNTTPLPEEEVRTTRGSGRGRGRPTTEAPVASEAADSVSDETQGSRGRTRANVRRPSLDLVDNASFNTHSNVAGSDFGTSGPSFPAELPAGPVRFLGATPNERMDLPAEAAAEEKQVLKEQPPREPAPISEDNGETATAPIAQPNEEITTVMSAMDKVALDLYAILQGTQKLSGEDEVQSTEEDNTAGATDLTEATTLEAITEEIQTTTPTTTTTTTTTTTPAPTTTTTTTTEAPSGRKKFHGHRNGVGGRKNTQQTSTTEASVTETKPKKFGRPSFANRSRPGAKTTAEPVAEVSATKDESKPSNSKPTISRARFGSSRPRGRTTAAPAESNEESSHSSTAAPASRPSLPRTRTGGFNLRSRGRTTAAPAETEEIQASGDASAAASSPDVTSTTTRSRRISTGGAVRPLRPGPRINLNGRRGAATSTTEAAAVEDHVTGDEEVSPSVDAAQEKQPETSPSPADNSPISRLRNRNRISVQARPKAAASAPVAVRRVNPLLARRRPGQTTEAPSSEAPQESPAEPQEEPAPVVEEKEPEPEAPSSTTEEPRGLNKLLAGRRRLVNRQPGTNH